MGSSGGGSSYRHWPLQCKMRVIAELPLLNDPDASSQDRYRQIVELYPDSIKEIALDGKVRL